MAEGALQDLPPHLEALVRSASARGRAGLERGLRPNLHRVRAARVWTLRLLGCVAIGIFSAGFAIFATAVILNLLFHFTPS